MMVTHMILYFEANRKGASWSSTPRKFTPFNQSMYQFQSLFCSPLIEATTKKSRQAQEKSRFDPVFYSKMMPHAYVISKKAHVIAQELQLFTKKLLSKICLYHSDKYVSQVCTQTTEYHMKQKISSGGVKRVSHQRSEHTSDSIFQ